MIVIEQLLQQLTRLFAEANRRWALVGGLADGTRLSTPDCLRSVPICAMPSEGFCMRPVRWLCGLRMSRSARPMSPFPRLSGPFQVSSWPSGRPLLYVTSNDRSPTPLLHALRYPRTISPKARLCQGFGHSRTHPGWPRVSRLHPRPHKSPPK